MGMRYLFFFFFLRVWNYKPGFMKWVNCHWHVCSTSMDQFARFHGTDASKVHSNFSAGWWSLPSLLMSQASTRLTRYSMKPRDLWLTQIVRVCSHRSYEAQVIEGKRFNEKKSVYVLQLESVVQQYVMLGKWNKVNKTRKPTYMQFIMQKLCFWSLCPTALKFKTYV